MPSPIFPVEEDPVPDRIDKRDLHRLPVIGAFNLRCLITGSK